MESRAHRDEVADGVRAGYIEAMVAAGTWKGRPSRWWSQREPQAGITGEALEVWFEKMAVSFPDNVH